MEFAIPQPKMIKLSRNDKQTYRLNSNVTMEFNLGHGLDHGFTMTNFVIAVSQKWEGQSALESAIHDLLVTNVRCEDLLDSDRGNFRYRRAVDSYGWFYGVFFSNTIAKYTILLCCCWWKLWCCVLFCFSIMLGDANNCRFSSDIPPHSG